MRVYNAPNESDIIEITTRPTYDVSQLNAKVSAILDDVKSNGDDALHRYSREFDKCRLGDLEVSQDEFDSAAAAVSTELKDAINLAISTIEKFHCSQLEEERIVETANGVFCWRRSVPIENVGIYVPAGTASLFSTVLMLSVPARIAGCSDIVLCSPPNAQGKVDQTVLYAAKVCGVTRAFKVGGAQAIAAMAFGTE